MNLTITFYGKRFSIEGLKIALLLEIVSVLHTILAKLSSNNFVENSYKIISILFLFTSIAVIKKAKMK
jgi:hypothetical protein